MAKPAASPPGHSASAIAPDSARSSPGTASSVVLAAAFTRASRVDAGKHNPWQELMGLAFGIFVARAFRRRVAAWRRHSAG